MEIQTCVLAVTLNVNTSVPPSSVLCSWGVTFPGLCRLGPCILSAHRVSAGVWTGGGDVVSAKSSLVIKPHTPRSSDS